MEKVITRFHFSPLGLWLYGFALKQVALSSLQLSYPLHTCDNCVLVAFEAQ